MTEIERRLIELANAADGTVRLVRQEDCWLPWRVVAYTPMGEDGTAPRPVAAEGADLCDTLGFAIQKMNETLAKDGAL